MLSYLLSVLLYSGYTHTNIIHPIILVPGDGGSQIEGRINRTYSPHFFCYDHTDWYDLWVNIEQLLPPTVYCWKENMKLRYNATSHSTLNIEGVETRIPGFGDTFSIEYLEKSKRSVGFYFVHVVEALVKEGYVRGKTVRGAPYDFRRAANEQAEYFAKLKNLIEETYKGNGNIPVLLVTHSMGSIMSLKFLTNQTQGWKDQYVRSFISIAGVWGGTVDAVKVFAVGDDLNSRFLSERSLLWQRTCSSLAWLMPSRDFWSAHEVLVTTPDTNFTRSDLFDLFQALTPQYGPNMHAMLEDTQDLLKGLPAPTVEVHCIHSSSIPTVEQMSYRKGYFPNHDPDYINGDGDGTVNTRSLEGCLKWQGEQKQPIVHTVIPGFDHLGILSEEKLLDHLMGVVRTMNFELQLEAVNIQIF